MRDGFYDPSQVKIFDYPKTGLPHGAGYAVGYRLVRDYLAKTGKNIFMATQQPSEEILSEIAPF